MSRDSRQADATLEGYLCQLASHRSPPAGGVAAAVSGAQGAALLAMCARVSRSRARGTTLVGCDFDSIIARADDSRHRLVAEADADAEGVRNLLNLAHNASGDDASGDDTQGSDDLNQLVNAYRAVIDVPAGVAAICLSQMDLCELMAPACYAPVKGDALAALRLLAIAVEISLENISLNLRMLRNELHRLDGTPAIHDEAIRSVDLWTIQAQSMTATYADVRNSALRAYGSNADCARAHTTGGDSVE